MEQMEEELIENLEEVEDTKAEKKLLVRREEKREEKNANKKGEGKGEESSLAKTEEKPLNFFHF